MSVLATLFSKAVASITAPREVAQWVMSFDLPRGMRWEALLLSVILSVSLQFILTTLVGDPAQVLMGDVMSRPFMAAIVQASSLVVTVFAIYWIGHAMGGQGGFGETILLVAWLMFCLFLLGLVQLVLLFIAPPLANLISFASIVLFFWLLSNFVAELHGFQSVTRVFLMVLVSLFGIAFGLSILLTLIGISIPGVPANV